MFNTLRIVTHVVVTSDGQGRVNAEITKDLARKGYQIELIASDVDEDILALPNVKWHRVVAPEWLPTRLLRYQWFACKVGLLLLRLPKADILQLNGGIAYLARGDVNISHFVHSDWLRSRFHPSRGRFGANAAYQYLYATVNSIWERRAYRQARRVVAVSSQIREALKCRTGIDISKVDVIHPGVDKDQFRTITLGEKNLLRSEMNIGSEPLVLLFAGDIRSVRKNVDLILRAMDRLQDEDIMLAIIGDASRSSYPELAKELGIAHRVFFLGRRNSDLAELMRGADVFAFASHYDPFGLVVTEAMASGLVVITAPTAGASTLLEEGVNGFVLSSDDDLDRFVEIVRLLNADRLLLRKIGAAARATAENWVWSDMAARYEKLYQETVLQKSAKDTPRLSASDPYNSYQALDASIRGK